MRYGPLNERQQRYVNHIHTSGQHLLRLINDILGLSQIEAGRLKLTLEDVQVNRSFGEISDALQPLVDTKSQKLVQFASPELVVRADGTRFRQILMNLIGNPIKFTPKGGRIELAARPLGDFHHLKQSDKTTEGTGLGLAITRSLVELQGGQLDLESESGSGSCFYFTLPTAVTPDETLSR